MTFFPEQPSWDSQPIPANFRLVKVARKFDFSSGASLGILFILISSTISNLPLDMNFYFRKQEKSSRKEVLRI